MSDLSNNDAVAVANAKEAKLAQKAAAKAARLAAKAEAKAERAAQKVKAKTEKEQARRLAEMAEAKLLKQLTQSLKTHARSATFACGGSASFKEALTGEAMDEDTTSTAGDGSARGLVSSSGDAPEKTEKMSSTSSNKQPAIDNVQIRFGESGKGITVVFSSSGISFTDLEHLNAICQPTSFGRGGEAVLDETYRKAGKLDQADFATSFCPYEADIIDVVTQLLLPQYEHDKHSRSVRAELCALNVYSAPSGRFKSHVDTPRGKDQIGSLVGCLPSVHEGGELAVRNAKQEVVLDWSSTVDEGPAEVKWAAFYSDCEHEVYEVTSGHRVTLTYNLYVARGAGDLAGVPNALNPRQLSLCESLETALSSPGFLRRGRVLAVWLNHSYAHTSEHLNFLPASLKGADMSLWDTAQGLGLKCIAVPIMSLGGWHDEDLTHVYEPGFRGFNQAAAGDFPLDEYGPYWGYEMPESKITWLNWLEENKKHWDGAGKEKDVKA